MKAAVLDLGTNTFNLLIGEATADNRLNILHSSKIPVKLGERGINKGEISPQSYNRGIYAILEHYNTIRKYNPDKIKAFGTSAFRTARNGNEFISEIKSLTGIDIETISGDEEAEFIYHGVKQTIPDFPDKYLILDIGGGSNEFILADNSTIYWKKSYPLGIARQLERFKPADPLTVEQLQIINNYLARETSDLKENIIKHNITTLIGASGAFETFVAMIHEWGNFETQTGLMPESIEIPLSDFDKLYKKLIFSSSTERMNMKGLEPMRIEMIVLAIHFVKFVTGSLNIKRIIQSNFSLKEGAILNLLNLQ